MMHDDGDLDVLEVDAEDLDLNSAFDDDAIDVEEVMEEEEREIGQFVEGDDDFNSMGPGPAPVDKCRGAFIMFLIMGIGLLFPWNAILQATDFFLEHFPCSPIEFDLSVAYMASVLITMIIILAILQFTKGNSTVIRVTIGFVLMMLSLVIYAAAGDSITYLPAVFTTVLSGVGDGLAQTGLYGMSSTLPERYTTATMIGNGVSGVVVTILRIATKGAFTQDLEGLLASTRMYFSIATVFVTFCIVCVVTIDCVPIVKYYRTIDHYQVGPKAADGAGGEAAKDNTTKVEDSNNNNNSDSSVATKTNELNKRQDHKVVVVRKRKTLRCLAVMTRMKGYAALVFSTFLLTLAVYVTAHPLAHHAGRACVCACVMGLT